MDGSGSLQSGFVLAVLVASVLFVEQLGGDEALVRRLFQIALAATLAFTVISGTSAAIRPPDFPAESSGFSDSSSSDEDEEQLQFFEDLSTHNSAVTSIHFALGVAGVVLGAALMRSRSTTATALALGGLLLILFGGPSASDSSSANPLSSLFGLHAGALGSVVGKGSVLADSVRFAVFAAGAVALLLYGILRWDAPDETVSAPSSGPTAAA